MSRKPGFTITSETRVKMSRDMRIKHKRTKSLHKKAWELQSQYIRRSGADSKGNNFCFTCGAKHHWKELDLGHYIHKDCLDFDPINLHPQCTYCNRFKHGNLGVYAERLIAEYGEGAVAELRVRSEQIKKFTVQELQDLINLYKTRLQEMTK